MEEGQKKHQMRELKKNTRRGFHESHAMEWGSKFGLKEKRNQRGLYKTCRPTTKSVSPPPIKIAKEWTKTNDSRIKTK